ncbi:MAG: hypothetical protein C0506_06230 [Anaerolinea sp.]|nr:hypothetical protein [Anaerolinea sp.]
MRRNALIALLLLPLPFAALPVVGVLIGGANGPGEIVIDAHVAEYGAPVWDLPEESAGPLAYGVSEPSHFAGCEVASDLRIEG